MLYEVITQRGGFQLVDQAVDLGEGGLGAAAEIAPPGQPGDLPQRCLVEFDLQGGAVGERERLAARGERNGPPFQAAEADGRITSYNVCYTKLLRALFFSLSQLDSLDEGLDPGGQLPLILRAVVGFHVEHGDIGTV